jgi:transposase-like protein
MDERTGFCLVSIITKTREIGDARKAFKKSKEVGNRKSRLMVTDGLHSYKKALNSEFYDHHRA